MTYCFAVIPDGGADPAALFNDLEDAIDWAVERFGSDQFSIRHFTALGIASESRHAAIAN